jgi:hypothetical protein
VTLSLNDPNFSDPVLSYLSYPVSSSIFICNEIITAYEIVITKNDVSLKLHMFLGPWIEEFLTCSPVKSVRLSPSFYRNVGFYSSVRDIYIFSSILYFNVLTQQQQEPITESAQKGEIYA